MRHQLKTTGLAFGLALVAGTAGAQTPNDWYVAGALTGSYLNDSDGTVANAPAPGQTIVLSNSVQSGWGGQLALGRAFGPIRVEAEVGRTQNDSNRYSVLSPFVASIPQDGENEITRYMGNAFFDFGTSRLQPYVGVGIGVADVHVVTVATVASMPGAPPRRLVDDSETDFAYQLMAGAALSLTPRLSLTAQYRWFDAGTVEGQDSRGERFTREIAGHNIDAGLRLRF